jgi:hypothetical protein
LDDDYAAARCPIGVVFGAMRRPQCVPRAPMPKEPSVLTIVFWALGAQTAFWALGVGSWALGVLGSDCAATRCPIEMLDTAFERPRRALQTPGAMFPETRPFCPWALGAQTTFWALGVGCLGVGCLGVGCGFLDDEVSDRARSCGFRVNSASSTRPEQKPPPRVPTFLSLGVGCWVFGRWVTAGSPP